MAQALTVKQREKGSHSRLKKMRQEGNVPGVIYGKELGNYLVQAETGELHRILQHQGTSAVISLKMEGKKYNVMISELQQDHIKGRLLHVDFHVINMKEPVDTEVTIELEGKPVGLKEGGILQQQKRTVEIRCLPNRIPEQLSIDIGQLAIGDSVTVADLQADKGIEFLSEAEEVVASVLPPQMEQEQEAEELDEASAGASQAEAEEGSDTKSDEA